VVSLAQQPILILLSSAIQDSPRHIYAFFQKLAEETGWAFTVLMGGLNPAKSDGEISTCRSVFHACPEVIRFLIYN
jgi:hypothetical protein